MVTYSLDEGELGFQYGGSHFILSIMLEIFTPITMGCLIMARTFLLWKSQPFYQLQAALLLGAKGAHLT